MKKALLFALLPACSHPSHVNRSQAFIQNLDPQAEILGHDSVLFFEGTVMTVCLPDAQTKRIRCYPLGDLNPPQKQQQSPQNPPQETKEAPKEEPKKEELPKSKK